MLDGLLDGVTEPEFQRAKAQVKASYILGMESVAAKAANLGRCELTFGRSLPDEEVLAALDGVTRDEVDALIRTLFAANPPPWPPRAPSAPTASMPPPSRPCAKFPLADREICVILKRIHPAIKPAKEGRNHSYVRCGRRQTPGGQGGHLHPDL